MPAGAMNLFRSRVDVFEAINRCDWQKVKDAVVPGKVSYYDTTVCLCCIVCTTIKILCCTTSSTTATVCCMRC